MSEAVAQDEIRLDVKDYINYLKGLYDQQILHVRHHESMRAQITNYILVASVALFGLLAGQKIFGYDWQPQGKLAIAGLIVVLNSYGLVLILKYYERSHTNAEVAEQYRIAISNLFAKANFLPPETLRESAHALMRVKHPVNSRLRLHWMWIGFELILIAMALAAYALAILPQDPY